MDLQIFNALHSLTAYHWLLDGLFIFIAKYLPYVLIVGLLVLIFVSYKKGRDRLYYFLLSAFALLVSRGLIVEGIRFFYYRPRPFQDLGFEPLIEPLTSGAMPSGHTTIFFTIATLMFFINRKYFWYFLVGAILVGLGRILVGLHWPSDVLVGAVLGIASVFAALWILPKSS